MNCEQWFERLYQILDSDLDKDVWQEVDEHMRHCPKCWDRFEFEKRLKSHIQQSCCKEPASNELRERIKALLEKY